MKRTTPSWRPTGAWHCTRMLAPCPVHYLTFLLVGITCRTCQLLQPLCSASYKHKGKRYFG